MLNKKIHSLLPLVPLFLQVLSVGMGVTSSEIRIAGNTSEHVAVTIKEDCGIK